MSEAGRDSSPSEEVASVSATPRLTGVTVSTTTAPTTVIPAPEATTDGDSSSEGVTRHDAHDHFRSVARDHVPAALHGLGEAFVRLPHHKKIARRPRTPEHLHAANDPVLGAHLDAGGNYGVVTTGDLAAVDADDLAVLAPALRDLPDTARQVTGSRESTTYFLRVPGLASDTDLRHPDDTEQNVGHIKAAPQSYVVGPGSIHDETGERYGPLHGDRIAEVDEDSLRETFAAFIRDTDSATGARHRDGRRDPGGGREDARAIEYDDTPLSVYDVLLRADAPEETRVAHPYHGSDTGTNFKVDEGGETWRCWRCDCTGNALHLIGMEQGIISCGEWGPGGLDTDTWREIFTAGREAGYDLGDDASGADYASADVGTFPWIAECAPLGIDHRTLDIDEERAEMATSAFQAARDGPGLTVWAHPPGVGKTTTAALTAALSGGRHGVLVPSHENCHEFKQDSNKPGGYFHLKGAGQPAAEVCMAPGVAGETCPAHPDRACPTMCPVYTAPTVDEETRDRFTTLAAPIGVRRAHSILGLYDEPWHGDVCPWQAQFDTLTSADRVVTVHDYVGLKSVREHGLLIVDDLRGVFEETGELSTAALGAIAHTFRRLADQGDDDAALFREVETFALELARVVGSTHAADIDLGTLEAPDLTTTQTVRRWAGDGSRTYRDEPEPVAETLSRVGRAFYDTVLARFRDGTETTAPLDLTGLFAALAEVDGVDADACRVAARQPVVIDACPHCRSRVVPMNGRDVCPTCGWDEEHGPFALDEPARVTARPVETPPGTPAGAVTWTKIPPVDELPDPADVLILDATPHPRVYAALFGIPVNVVDVHGDEPYALPNATVTQIVDGQYHRQTITDSGAADRHQGVIDRLAEVHDPILYVCASKAAGALDFPDDAEVMHYGALRGLNRTDYEAVVCIGALHPPEPAIRDLATVLAQGRDDLRAGGAEQSTRLGACPPIWTKYDFTDADGNGRAVATKTYDGLTGELFTSVRENELEQAVHRVRPLLAAADDHKHIYLLTNVPTRLPVDTLTTIDGLTEPLRATLGVSETATALLEGMYTAAIPTSTTPTSTDGGAIEGTRAEWEAAAGAGDIPERTVQRALRDLRDAGHVEQTGHATNGAPVYRVTPDALDTLATLTSG